MLAAQGFSLTEKDLAKVRGEDQHDEELMAIAETPAYFRVAYKVSSNILNKCQ